MKRFSRNLQGNNLQFQMSQDSLVVKHLESNSPSALVTNKFQIKSVPESLSQLFANLNDLYEELSLVGEDKLQFSREGQLVYNMPTIRKIVKLIIPLQLLPLSKAEQIQAQNHQLIDEVARLKAAYEEKCKQHESCKQTINTLKSQLSELSLKQKASKNGHSESNGLKRNAPSTPCWDQPSGRKKLKGMEDERPIEQMQKFNFQPDKENPNVDNFVWSKNILKFRKQGDGEFKRVTSSQPIQRQGRISIELKMLCSSFNGILLGLIKQSDRYIPFDREQKQTLSLSLQGSKIIMRTESGQCEVIDETLKKGDTIQMVANRTKSHMYLFHNAHIVGELPVKFTPNTDYFAFVCMSNKSDEIEFL